MELRDAHICRAKWEGTLCLHEHIEEETISGEPTGNLACIYCGQVFESEGAMQEKAHEHWSKGPTIL